MTEVSGHRSVIAVTSLKAFFHQALREAAGTQKLDADDTIIAYLTHLLTDYARSDRLFDHTEDGLVRRPLVDIYKQASEAETTGERELALQRLGDLALFVSNILPHSLQRSLVDVDYYIAMGASAYGYLSDSAGPGYAPCARSSPSSPADSSTSWTCSPRPSNRVRLPDSPIFCAYTISGTRPAAEGWAACSSVTGSHPKAPPPSTEPPWATR